MFLVPPLEIQIRLQGSSVPNAGRVEVFYAGIWGAISKNNWDIDDARVACRQLGYQAGAEAALKKDFYGPVSGPVWLTNLHCSGSETNLMSCAHDVIGNKSELQRRQYVASVICKYGPLPSGNVWNFFSFSFCIYSAFKVAKCLTWCVPMSPITSR